MNNKKLAVVLSIVAVIVVVYQIFLRKDEQSVRKNKIINKVNKSNVKSESLIVTPLPSINNDRESDPLINESDNKNENRNNMIIDLYSPQLLKRVKPYFDKSRVELSDEIGCNIFGYKKIEAVSNKIETKEKKFPILALNGIIDLIKDNIKIAIINDKLYRRGDNIENAVIERIENYKVFLKFNKETIILTVNQEPYNGWIKKRR